MLLSSTGMTAAVTAAALRTQLAETLQLLKDDTSVSTTLLAPSDLRNTLEARLRALLDGVGASDGDRRVSSASSRSTRSTPFSAARLQHGGSPATGDSAASAFGPPTLVARALFADDDVVACSTVVESRADSEQPCTDTKLRSWRPANAGALEAAARDAVIAATAADPQLCSTAAGTGGVLALLMDAVSTVSLSPRLLLLQPERGEAVAPTSSPTLPTENVLFFATAVIGAAIPLLRSLPAPLLIPLREMYALAALNPAVAAALSHLSAPATPPVAFTLNDLGVSGGIAAPVRSPLSRKGVAFDSIAPLPWLPGSSDAAAEAEDHDIRLLLDAAVGGGGNTAAGASAAASFAPRGYGNSGPADLSMPFRGDVDSRNLNRGVADIKAFTAREALRDAFMELLRDYRDIGTSFSARSWPEFVGGVGDRLAGMATLLSPLSAPMFVRLFVHELDLFVGHDVLGTAGGDFAAAIARHGGVPAAAPPASPLLHPTREAGTPRMSSPAGPRTCGTLLEEVAASPCVSISPWLEGAGSTAGPPPPPPRQFASNEGTPHRFAFVTTPSLTACESPLTGALSPLRRGLAANAQRLEKLSSRLMGEQPSTGGGWGASVRTAATTTSFSGGRGGGSSSGGGGGGGDGIPAAVFSETAEASFGYVAAAATERPAPFVNAAAVAPFPSAAASGFRSSFHAATATASTTTSATNATTVSGAAIAPAWPPPSSSSSFAPNHVARSMTMTTGGTARAEGGGTGGRGGRRVALHRPSVGVGSNMTNLASAWPSLASSGGGTGGAPAVLPPSSSVPTAAAGLAEKQQPLPPTSSAAIAAGGWGGRRAVQRDTPTVAAPTTSLAAVVKQAQARNPSLLMRMMLPDTGGSTNRGINHHHGGGGGTSQQVQRGPLPYEPPLIPSRQGGRRMPLVHLGAASGGGSALPAATAVRLDAPSSQSAAAANHTRGPSSHSRSAATASTSSAAGTSASIGNLSGGGGGGGSGADRRGVSPALKRPAPLTLIERVLAACDACGVSGSLRLFVLVVLCLDAAAFTRSLQGRLAGELMASGDPVAVTARIAADGHHSLLIFARRQRAYATLLAAIEWGAVLASACSPVPLDTEEVLAVASTLCPPCVHMGPLLRRAAAAGCAATVLGWLPAYAKWVRACQRQAIVPAGLDEVGGGEEGSPDAAWMRLPWVPPLRAAFFDVMGEVEAGAAVALAGSPCEDRKELVTLIAGEGVWELFPPERAQTTQDGEGDLLPTAVAMTDINGAMVAPVSVFRPHFDPFCGAHLLLGQSPLLRGVVREASAASDRLRAALTALDSRREGEGMRQLLPPSVLGDEVVQPALAGTRGSPPGQPPPPPPPHRRVIRPTLVSSPSSAAVSVSVAAGEAAAVPAVHPPHLSTTTTLLSLPPDPLKLVDSSNTSCGAAGTPLAPSPSFFFSPLTSSAFMLQLNAAFFRRMPHVARAAEAVGEAAALRMCAEAAATASSAASQNLFNSGGCCSGGDSPVALPGVRANAAAVDTIVRATMACLFAPSSAAAAFCSLSESSGADDSTASAAAAATLTSIATELALHYADSKLLALSGRR